MEILKNHYHLVKAFWVDFYNETKRGTQRHSKGIKIFLVFCFIFFFFILAGLLKFSESHFFVVFAIR
jgi:hypothetical protein